MDLVRTKRYSELDPRRELEQSVARDFRLALEKREVEVVHHGTAAAPAPSTAPADITLDWKAGGKSHQLLVEVAQRTNESEFTSVVEHLNAAVAKAHGKEVNVLYSGRSTSARMVRFIRSENQRREANRIPGRIVFLRLDDLEELLQHWREHPKRLYPADALLGAVARWNEFVDDLEAFRVFQESVFPRWDEKAEEIAQEIERETALRLERLRRDIIHLENKLRERGITGISAHKTLIHLFFLALFEEKKGPASRFTREGFLDYKKSIPPAHRRSGSDYHERTVHYIFEMDVKHDPEIAGSGMLSQYEPIALTDDFILSNVIPMFEGYSFTRAGMDVIGAVFEALARRAEKDNRIGQFFTPETAVEATCKLAHLRPTDLVIDPACGTARFLIYAMSDMLAKAEEVAGVDREELRDSIKQRQLLGVDIDPWVATIAKMNMYLHGDGKSNVKHGNGLSLSIKPTFTPGLEGTLEGVVDAVLTNPPLGEINFREVGLELARRGDLGKVPADAADYDKRISSLAADWSNRYLGVVPHVCNERVDEERYRELIEKWRRALYDAEAEENEKAIASARRHLASAEAKLADVQRRIGAGKLTYTASGSTTKGSALFLSVIKDYLKDVRDPNAPEESKGGVVGIVIDEAVLNTPDYEQARVFVLKNFFVKAVVSLPRDAFAYVAKTTAKTSVLILCKEPDPSVVQREPVFYARAESIGFDSGGKRTENDLIQITQDYDAWTEATRSIYGKRAATGPFDQARYDAAADGLEGRGERFWDYALDPSKPGERLDFSYKRMKDEIARMGKSTALNDVVDLVVRTPKERSSYTFATASRLDGRVRRKGEDETSYKALDLRVIKEGDILFSGIDLINGAVGVVGADCDGMVVSKEYYTVRPKTDEEGRPVILPEFLAALLRSHRMQVIIEGTITGTSNRTRIQDIESFLQLPIPRVPPVEKQEAYTAEIRRAYALQDEAIRRLGEVQEGITAKLFK